jgi:hypothetical protein
MNKVLRIFLLLLYGSIFIISIFSVFRLSCIIYNEAFIFNSSCPFFEQVVNINGTDMMSSDNKPNFQFTLFIFSASISLMLFFTEFYFNNVKNAKDLIIDRYDKEIKEIIKKEKSKK